MSKLLAKKKQKRFVTSIFHKATFSGVFTNYDSFIFDTCKIGLFSQYTLLFQFFKICFIMKNVRIEIEHLRCIFKYNNYHVSIIDQCIKKFLDKLYVPKQIVPTVPKRELLVVLLFFGRFSLNLRKHLNESVGKSLAQCNMKVIFQSKSRLNACLNSMTAFPYIFAPTLFENVTDVIAILLITAKLNVILKLELVSI